jgi:hypothetical protein
VLELISTDLVIKTKSISHALIGGVLPYSSDSGSPLHSDYKKHGNRSSPRVSLNNLRTGLIPVALQQWEAPRPQRRHLPQAAATASRPYTVTGAASRSSSTTSPKVSSLFLPKTELRLKIYFNPLRQLPTSANPSRSPHPQVVTRGTHSK